jgi:integrase
MTKGSNPGIYRINRTWTAHIHWTDSDNKTQQHKRGGFATKDDAIRYRTKYLSELHSGRRRGTTKLRLEQYLLNEWLPNREGEIKRSTYASYVNVVNTYLIPYLGHIRLEELTVKKVESFYQELLKTGATGKSRPANSPLSPKTVSNIAGVLARAYRDAVRWEFIAVSPISASRKPSKRTKEMTAWEPHELGEFVDAIQGERLQAVWHLLALSGMRRGEVLGLLWSDIDLKKGKIHVRSTRIRAGNQTIEETPKSKKSRRTISIDPRTIKILEKWRLNQTKERFAVGELWSDKDGHLVTEPDGTLPNPNTFTKRFKAICKQKGLRIIRLHDIRHSYVVAAHRSGVDMKVISEHVGHADWSVTNNVYNHVFVKDDEEATDSIANHIYGVKSS